MTPQQTLFAKWSNKWMEARSKYLASQLEDYLRQYAQNKLDLPIARARLNKMSELSLPKRDNDYLRRQDQNIFYYSGNLINLAGQIKTERAKVRRARQAFVGKQNFIELYSKLRRHRMIASLLVVGNKFQITTKQILNKKVEFGKFEILIGHTIGDYVVRNLTWEIPNTDSAFAHPHIRRGEICLGNYRDGVYAYDKQGDLYLLIDTLIHFLELADGKRDAYVNREEWLAKRQKIKS